MSPKLRDEWKTMPSQCPNCTRCRIFIEGPSKGRCVQGGPYSGYRYDRTHPDYHDDRVVVLPLYEVAQ